MHFLVARTSRGKLILSAEYEAAIVDYAFRRMAVLHLARLAIG